MISIVIPCFNEELIIEDFIKELKSNLDNSSEEYEIIFIDNSSQDRTVEIIQNNLKKLNILIDQSLGRFQSVFAAAGHPNSIFKIDISKLKDLTKGRVEDITE